MTETHEVAPTQPAPTQPAPTQPAPTQPAAAEPAAGAPATGSDRVDAVVRSLDSYDGRPAEEHVAVFEAAHRELRDILSSTDDPA